jgi:DNA-binding response OmpR family regulator
VFEEVTAVHPYKHRAKPTILVVDDSKSVRELLTLHLSGAGYEVLTAEDAIVAGKLVVEHSPDLLIVDVNMPYMSGTEFVEALRDDPHVCGTPVIFLTARDDIAHLASKLRAAAYLGKPITAHRLLEVVALHVNGEWSSTNDPHH